MTKQPITSAADDTDLGVPMRVAVASLSFGAGAIHLAMATSHAGNGWPRRRPSRSTGGCRCGLALAFAVRPSKAALVVACVANLLLRSRRGRGPEPSACPFGPERATCTTPDSSTSRPLCSKCRWSGSGSTLALAMPTARHSAQPRQRRRLRGHSTVRARARDRSARVAERSRSRARRRRGRCRDARPCDT